jgi:hypothetical protein
MKITKDQANRIFRQHSNSDLRVIHAYSKDDFIKVKKSFDELIQKNECDIILMRKKR